MRIFLVDDDAIIRMGIRKIIEKAKGIIMSKTNFSENDAFRYIQKNSMDKGMKMVDYSKKIILENEI